MAQNWFNIGAYMRRTRSPWLPILPFLSNLLRSHMLLGGFSHNAREARWNWKQAKCGQESCWKQHCMLLFSFLVFSLDGFNTWDVGQHTDLSPSSTLIYPSSTFFKRSLQAHDSQAAGGYQAIEVNPACCQTWTGGCLTWALRYPKYASKWLISHLHTRKVMANCS